MPELDLKIKWPISDKLLADILETAMAGSVQYWCEVVSYTQTESPENCRAEIIVGDEGDDGCDGHASTDGPIGNVTYCDGTCKPGAGQKHYTITTEVIRLGAERILNAQPDDIQRLLADERSSFTNYYMIYKWLMSAVMDDDASMVDDPVSDLVIQYGLFKEAVYG